MFRIDSSGAATTLPTPTAYGTPGYFAAAGAAQQTIVTNDWANAVQEELVAPVLKAGLSLDKTNNGQVLAALTTLFAGEWALEGNVGTNSVTSPAWATRVEVICVGGGGAGSNCIAGGGSPSTSDVSGGGGSSGRVEWGYYTVTPSAAYSLTVGAGGTGQGNGGTTSFGSLVSAAGGLGTTFTSTGFSPGAGSASATANPGNFLSLPGGSGADGQASSLIFAGNGGNTPLGLGGGGRAANNTTGSNGGGFGAGGGGVYDSTNSNTTRYGGNGAPGVILYRWLP